VLTLACDFADPSSVQACREQLCDAEAVVHLAGHVPEDTGHNAAEDAYATLRSNVIGTARLLWALGPSSRLSCFVYASTFEVHGMPEHLPVDEEHPTRPLGYYGASKLAGEKYVTLFSRDRGVACCSLRMAAIYGPGDTLKRAIGNFIRAGAVGGELVVYGDGEDRRELLYAGDAAVAVALAIQKHACGAINVASGSGYSIREMAEAVLQAAGGGVRVAYRDRVKPRMDYVLAIDRARERLGWQPRTSLREGVHAQFNWMRACG
jgi:UDP-glucose 4-epimerase